MMKKTIGERITKLREKMRERGIDAYLILTDDFHASEYVCDYFKCREYMSGFSGSAGTLVVTMYNAALWTDGRYFIQAEEQLKDTEITLMKMGEEGVPSIQDYLYEQLSEGGCLGFDGRTISVNYVNTLNEKLCAKNIEYVDNVDLVGEIWEDRPEFPSKPIWFLSEKYAGKSVSEKLAELRAVLRSEKAEAILISSLDDIAWLYNLRGDDMLYNPVALAYTIVYENSAVLYRNPDTVRGEIADKLKKDGVIIAPYFQIYEDIKQLRDITLFLDERSVNLTLRNLVPQSVLVVNRMNPTTIFKAKKNPVEIKNERYAHILDGVAVTKLIYWIKQKQKSGNIKEITELDVCDKLEQLRRQQEGYLQQSFAPIIAIGAHGAIVHYAPDRDSNTALEDNTFLLMDTGGQYLFGTTDITRTISIGELTREQKMHYTAVLKGNINLACARFKYGCTGVNLDCLARKSLWELGLDFNHGTGHGVGYLLNVHEGPNGIRMRENDGTSGVVLEEGMITSNEPGLYLEGKYGIRIENLMLCMKYKKTEFGQFMKFDTLTMVPFDREAILPERMTEEEIKNLNHYHNMVYETISPYLNEEECKWLREQTKEMKR